MSRGERESALLVPISQAEAVVGPFRAKHDGAAIRGVPAHVTLLYPFVPPAGIGADLIEELRGFFAEEPALAFLLMGPVRFPEDAILFLALEPAGPTIRLIGRLLERYPEYPRYGRTDIDVIPHLTVADDDPVGWEAIEDALRPALPIDVFAEEAWLMEEGEDGMWRFRERFPFGSLV